VINVLWCLLGILCFAAGLAGLAVLGVVTLHYMMERKRL